MLLSLLYPLHHSASSSSSAFSDGCHDVRLGLMRNGSDRAESSTEMYSSTMKIRCEVQKVQLQRQWCQSLALW